MAYLWKELAQEIQLRLDRYAQGVLPPTAELCRLHRVSLPTLLKALHFLRDQGLIELSRGRRAVVAGSSTQHAGSAPLPSRARVSERIQERIEQGVYRAGMPLPKIAVLSSEEGVSQQTVCAALRGLSDRRLVRKEGRQWIAGRDRGHLGTQTTHTPPRELLIVQLREGAWESVLTPRTRRFVESFETEAQYHGVKLTPGVVESTRRSGFCALDGLDRVMTHAATIGDRYAGAIGVARTSDDLTRMTELARTLPLSRPMVVLSLLAHEPPPASVTPPFTVCEFSETAFSEAALDFATAMGHRKLAFAGGFGKTRWDWQAERLSVLEKAAARRPSTEVLSWRDALERVSGTGRRQTLERLSTLARTGPSYTRKALTFVQKHFQTGTSLEKLADLLVGPWHSDGFAPPGDGDIAQLLPFLLTEGITCWIASRDFMARHILLTLGPLGIRFPDDLSLISYDNYLNCTVLPVTTIDNGAANLGYRAFHMILRDIAVRARPDGRLVAEPRVVDRGTVAPLRGGFTP